MLPISILTAQSRFCSTIFLGRGSIADERLVHSHELRPHDPDVCQTETDRKPGLVQDFDRENIAIPRSPVDD